MDRIRHCAEISVGRGLAFALLAVATFAIGMSGDPPLAVRATAILLSLTAVILWRKGLAADRVPYRRRELWLMLDRRHDLPEERAQALISSIVRQALLERARRVGWVALGCWIVDFGWRLMG